MSAQAERKMVLRSITVMAVFILLSLAFAGMGSPRRTDTLYRLSNFRAPSLSKPVDSIVVVKRFRHMFVFHNRKLLKVYHISLGEAPVGAKHFEGDRKTPEGIYTIDGKNPNSQAHKALAISYPNENDRKYAKSKALPPGGNIKIHGLLNGTEKEKDDYMSGDWTWGCIAVNNEDMDELYANVKIGTVINILP